MLHRSFRLQKQDIARIYKKGRSFREDFLFCRILANRASNSRFAVVIPKSVAAKATDRNRLKRKTHTILAELIKISIPLNYYDIMLTYKAVPDEVKIEPVLKHIFQKIGILK